MPSLSKDATVGPLRAKTTITLPLEHQVLKSACVLDVNASNKPNDAFVIIGLMEGGTNHQNKISLLASGYVGASAMIGWTGSIPVTPDTFLFADIFSTNGGVFRLSAIPWKIIGTKNGLVVVDP